ncbi:MAG: hypothetical protein H7Y07_13210 [Pyrinomonadaceae bacterium]|nr:hypothetical protein [Sphingobacteriaceae bacterium]
MTKTLKNILICACFLSGLGAFAQSTTSSPYSQFGIGLISGSQLPQNRSLGGLAAGLRNPSSYSSINILNPASYSAIRITTFDIGVYAGNTTLSKGSVSESAFDASLNHLTFGIPVTKTSALSFGLVPYSSKGYNFRSSGMVGTQAVDYVYSAEGGISKAYLGYGIKAGKKISIGANASYLFGKLKEARSAEYADISFLNSSTQQNNSISGLTFDLGLQYETAISKNVNFILGYAASTSSKLKSSGSLLTTRFYKNGSGNANVAVDSTQFVENAASTIQLPMLHTLGFTMQRTNKWLFGADLSLGQWENYREGNVNPGLQNSMGLAVGGQITPDVNSVGNYLKLVDYRFGFKYDKTYIHLKNKDINQMAVTLGLGLPLASNRSTFYKINLGTELGQRGSLQNNLVRERYVNFFIGFTMNDQWFQKYKFD